jgi:DNA-binding FrmR family transcriptional regulator
MAGEGTPKNDLVNRLSRIEGQVQEINKMVEQDKYCIETLTQVAARRARRCSPWRCGAWTAT